MPKMRREQYCSKHDAARRCSVSFLVAVQQIRLFKERRTIKRPFFSQKLNVSSLFGLWLEHSYNGGSIACPTQIERSGECENAGSD